MERARDKGGSSQEVYTDHLGELGFFEEYFLFLQSNLIETYKMNPLDIEELYLGEVLYYHEKLKQMRAQEELLEIIRYKMLISVIHGEPNEVLEKLNQIEKGEIVDDEVGDLNAIEKLKASRGWAQ